MVITKVILHPITGHQGKLSVYNKPTLTDLIDTHSPGFAVGLVVISKKCQILLLVTTATLVSTCCIIAKLQMRGHTLGSSTALLGPNKIRLVADQEFSPVSI